MDEFKPEGDNRKSHSLKEAGQVVVRHSWRHSCRFAPSSLVNSLLNSDQKKKKFTTRKIWFGSEFRVIHKYTVYTNKYEYIFNTIKYSLLY